MDETVGQAQGRRHLREAERYHDNEIRRKYRLEGAKAMFGEINKVRVDSSVFTKSPQEVVADMEKNDA